ncbi:aminotransferase class I/II-fold pyridoxal phosphate-dependent enzyme [Chitinophaga sancti]|uniref:7-keto-8-aminopelargonate synthetase n=1 Tax=Chitinophaga sancti TaxID=1004 RepID=A0A1K1RSV3_9BACT|nr:aminotransferase class I/II-fold pyridoxal phosphate-dependent enzyme [Chitinophaga sancti]WQD62404.1 aminotransferase class I/II-fold pyridoxal phosphate-dependent enzyme [Chitinophaga sancti]WQG92027.1 aminotransferase class I/II-fold pyridoxal phosphate-dependent enzyme [Chitinophaga sancti]SFW75371.1 7-keto-8-aminopelargonate synthetase [Chitinophaga sancti]
MHLHTNSTPDKITHVSGKEYLFFSGFSYLGLHAHPQYKEALRNGIDLYGTVFVSSRIANLRLDLYEELDDTLAEMLRQPAAASFSSGYLASQAAIQYAATKGELCYSPTTHPSLRLGKVILPNLSWEEWTTQTIEKINAWPDNTFVIVADGVNPLTSTINDFSWLSEINKEVMVVIDDSHGFGVLGTDGGGIIHSLPSHPPLRYLLSASLAKAFSIQGGVVSGRLEDVIAIKKMPAFTAGTSLMPASAWAFLQSRTLFRHQRKIMHQRIAEFSTLTAGMAQLHNPSLLPIFVLNAGIEKVLENKGIIISSFGYPNPDSPPVNRIVITALHQTPQLQTLHLQLQRAFSSKQTD